MYHMTLYVFDSMIVEKRMEAYGDVSILLEKKGGKNGGGWGGRMK